MNILASLGGGLLLGAVLALAIEMLNRRVRDPEDMIAMPGVPVIGVLRPADSRRPIFRRLTSGVAPHPSGRPLLPGVRS
jgi:hypothetical protein